MNSKKLTKRKAVHHITTTGNVSKWTNQHAEPERPTTCCFPHDELLLSEEGEPKQQANSC